MAANKKLGSAMKSVHKEARKAAGTQSTAGTSEVDMELKTVVAVKAPEVKTTKIWSWVVKTKSGGVVPRVVIYVSRPRKTAELSNLNLDNATTT